jgi:hypothetical protein
VGPNEQGKKFNCMGQKALDLLFHIDRPHLEALKKRKVS